MADDYRNDTTTTGTLTIGGSATGAFESFTDADWFKITLQAGTTYLFSLSGAAQGGGTLSDMSYSSVGVWNSQGQSLTSSSGAASASGPVAQYAVSTTGVYYVSATVGYYATGTYTLAASLPAPDDFAANTSTTGVLLPGVATAGKLELSGDVDWFKFHAEAGQQYALTSGTGAGLLQSLSLSMYDVAGKYIGSVGQGPIKVAYAGDYFIAATGYTIGAYTQTLKLLSDDYSSDNLNPGQIEAGTTVKGTQEFYGDEDRFTVSLEAGKIYTMELAMSPAESYGPGITIYDGNGSSVYVGDSYYANGKLTVRYTPTKGGVYSLNVADSNWTGTPHPYTLSLSLPDTDDYGGTTATATALALGVPVSGSIQSAGDIDMFKTVLAAGVTYAFALVPASGTGTARLSILDGNGSTVATPPSGQDKYFTYTPTVAGTYYLSANNSFGGPSMPYTLNASVAVDDFGASAGGAGRLSIGGSMTGVLETGGGDRDWFAVTLSAGGTYWFNLDGSREGGGTLSSGSSSPQFRLMDASGAVLSTAPYNYNVTASVLSYVAPTSGTYYVEVAAPGGSGTYTVRARIGERDDYGADTAHAGALKDGVATNGKLELSYDRDMFKISAVAGVTYLLELAPGADVGSNANWGYYTGLSVSDGASGYVSVRSQPSVGNKIAQVFEATKSGDYYVTVGSASSSSVAGSYLLTATAQAPDDYPATYATTGLLAPATPVRGVIGLADDHDWVKVRLEQGRTYVFDMQGSVSGGGTLDTSQSSAGMALYGVAGYYVALSSLAGVSAGGEPRLSYIAPSSGDFYLDVHGNGSQKGSYTISETLTNSDTAAPLLQSASMASGATGVAPNARIVLTFNETVVLGSAAGSAITLKDANGVALASSVNGSLSLLSAVGHSIVIDPHLGLKPGTTYTLALPEASVLDLAGNHYAGAQSITFTVASTAISGSGGNDYLVGSGNGMVLNGGAGLDAALYDKLQSETQISRNASGQVTVKNTYSSTGDTLTGVERLLFRDKAVALDIDGVGGQTYRLYQAAFNRTPDSGGLGYWIAAMDQGSGLKSVADNFMRSAEFQALYGADVSDIAFVKLLYTNVLHRDPDAGGQDFWLQTLHGGATRADLLASFSESAENVASAAVLIGNGFSYTPYF